MSYQKDCRLYYHNSFISLRDHSFRSRSLTLLLTWCSSWEASLCFTLNDRRHQLCTVHSNRGYHNCLVFSIIFLSLPSHQQSLIFPTIIYFWLQSIVNLSNDEIMNLSVSVSFSEVLSLFLSLHCDPGLRLSFQVYFSGTHVMCWRLFEQRTTEGGLCGRFCELISVLLNLV